MTTPIYRRKEQSGTVVIEVASTRKDQIAQLKNQLDKQGYVISANERAGVHTLTARKTK